LTKLKVELFGMARRLSQAKEVEIEIGDKDTYRHVSRALAERFPAFLGHIITPTTFDLLEPYFFNVDARRVVQDLDEMPEPDKPLLLFFVDAGG